MNAAVTCGKANTLGCALDQLYAKQMCSTATEYLVNFLLPEAGSMKFWELLQMQKWCEHTTMHLSYLDKHYINLRVLQTLQQIKKDYKRGDSLKAMVRTAPNTNNATKVVLLSALLIEEEGMGKTWLNYAVETAAAAVSSGEALSFDGYQKWCYGSADED